MATLASSPPTSPSWPKRRPRAWALRCERYCCAAASCFPLVFVYGITTWAIYVAVNIGVKPSRSDWIGKQEIRRARHRHLRILGANSSYRQASLALSSHLLFTPSSTSPIPSPFSRIRGRRSPPAVDLAAMITALSRSRNTRNSPLTLSHPLVNRDTARNANVRSRTARITARPASDASSKWTTTVRGWRHASDCITTKHFCSS
jgi:hypothetical protein